MIIKDLSERGWYGMGCVSSRFLRVFKDRRLLKQGGWVGATYCRGGRDYPPIVGVIKGEHEVRPYDAASCHSESRDTRDEESRLPWQAGFLREIFTNPLPLIPSVATPRKAGVNISCRGNPPVVAHYGCFYDLGRHRGLPLQMPDH